MVEFPSLRSQALAFLLLVGIFYCLRLYGAPTQSTCDLLAESIAQSIFPDCPIKSGNDNEELLRIQHHPAIYSQDPYLRQAHINSLSFKTT
jgi:hypothetical protein